MMHAVSPKGRTSVSGRHGHRVLGRYIGGTLGPRHLPCPRHLPTQLNALSEPEQEIDAEAEDAGRDPLRTGRWYRNDDGVALKLPDYDFSNTDWMQRVASDIGWDEFWTYFELLTEGDPEWDAKAAAAGEPEFTASGRVALDAETKRRAALEAQTYMMNDPSFVSHGLDVTEADIIPEPTVLHQERVDWEDAWTLRARREKAAYREDLDFFWQCVQQDGWHLDQINMSDLTDVRLQSKIRDERYDWDEASIWNLITNDGVSVDPFIVREAETFRTENPFYIQDWASQGITYVDETEEWLEGEGRWAQSGKMVELFDELAGEGEDDDEDEGGAEEDGEEVDGDDVVDVEGVELDEEDAA